MKSNTLYSITGLCPRTDIQMGRWGFGIKLWPGWKEAVALAKLDQTKVDTVIKNLGRSWLYGCGYGKLSESGDGKSPLYPTYMIRVTWGQWGIHHLTVPGDACGLDISDSIGGPRDGKMLGPHNIDSMCQAMLLLCVFTWFADLVICEADDSYDDLNKPQNKSAKEVV